MDHPVPVITRIPRSWVCQGREAEEEQKGGSGFLFNAFILKYIFLISNVLEKFRKIF